ncbi:hypothetical protein KPC_1359 [Acinetobacter stercoris]|uniref:Uncharacterized protein n=2 Tax=Acinetobacter stercoris TaxID=2126983 RepID=A0A2U3MXP9_9GAMM|nr:hypothetical protein KPC_1359 [Acinetobacter stercoris]
MAFCAVLSLFNTAYADSICDQIEELAGKIMFERQSGLPLNEAIKQSEIIKEKAQEISETNPQSSKMGLFVAKLSYDLTQEAYRQPFYDGENGKNLAVEKYRQDAKFMCMQDRSKE